MIPFRDELGIPRTGLALLRDLIHERTGLYYDDTRFETLAEKLGPLVAERGFRSYLDLYYLLKYEDSPADWTRVMDALSVQETYFWREVDQIRAIVDTVVPALAASNGAHALRIWSAPCASGEEPLTIAMMLEEAGWFDRVPIEIHAADASPVAIAKARAGVYRDRSFRTLPPALAEKYFTRTADGAWCPAQRLRDRITSYSVLNLMDENATAPFAASPVVFCRNAFIYFSAEAVRRVVETFARVMPTPGFLCVGASESLLSATTAFALEQIDGAFVYVKR